MTPELNHLKSYNIDTNSFIRAVNDINVLITENRLHPNNYILAVSDVPVNVNLDDYSPDEIRLISGYITQNVVRMGDNYNRETSFVEAVNDMKKMVVDYPYVNRQYNTITTETEGENGEIVQTVHKVEKTAKGRKAKTIGQQEVKRLYMENKVNQEGGMKNKDFVNLLVEKYGMKTGSAAVYASNVKNGKV